MSRLGFLDKREEFPLVTRRLDLGRYHADLKGNYVEVWLNWSRDFNDRMVDYNDQVRDIQRMSGGTPEERAAVSAALDELFPTLCELNAEYWSCTPEEVEAIYNLDAELWRWITAEANGMREAYGERRKKVGGGSTRG